MTEDEKAEAVVDALADKFCDCQGTLPLYPTTFGWHCNRCDRICNRCTTALPSRVAERSPGPGGVRLLWSNHRGDPWIF